MPKEIVGYDWCNHFGYANINGNVMWNSDWNAGPFSLMVHGQQIQD